MDDEFEDADFGALLGDNTPQGTARASIASERPPATTTPASKVEQPKPQALPSRSGPSAILVSARQKGNPILNHVRVVPWEYADIPADYVLGTTTCALFLSLKYHRLHPEYVYSRIRLLGGKYNLRILLTMVDIENHEDSLKELSKTSLVNNLTLILCWSAAEAGHYLELFKASEKAQPTAIRAQQPQSYKESLTEFITSPRTINKSDAGSLISTFGSLQDAINAQPEQIGQLPGWGEKKVQQWCGAVREEFRVKHTAKRGVQQTKAASQAQGSVDGLLDIRREFAWGNESDGTSQLLSSVQNGGASNRPRPVPADVAEEAETPVLATGEDAQIAGGLRSVTSLNKTPKDDIMNEGVLAALAKLREQER